MRWVDLHVHSTASDGTTEPEMLLEKVLQSVREHGEEGKYDTYLLALTDHDTLAGVERLKHAAEKYPEFEILSGVEISCDYCGKEIHMLGLHVDEHNEMLLNRLAYYREFRKHRNEKILEKLRNLGIPVGLDDIPVKEGEAMGRPHIARYLLEHGYVSSIQEAFDVYLKKGRPCHVKREKPTSEEAIELILHAGGCPVLAHPMQYKKMNRTELDELVKKLKTIGLQGIETYYTEFSQEEVEFVEALSEKYSLIRTGGSDYHGHNKPEVALGYGFGNLNKTMDKIGEWKNE